MQVNLKAFQILKILEAVYSKFINEVLGWLSSCSGTWQMQTCP